MDASSMGDQYRAYKSWDRDSFGVETQESRLYYAAELSKAGVPDGPVALLEIGFGNGQLAAFARRRGYTYAGTELDPELVERAVEAGFDAKVAPQDLSDAWPAESFDVICCFDVLEHLDHDQIVAMLLAFRGLLKPQGRIIARFPSGDSPFSLGMQNGDITHRSHIGRGAVLQFCLATELTAAQIRHPSLPIRGLGPRRMLRRALVSAGRWVVRQFVRKIFFDGIPRVVDPNMLVVLQRA